MPASDALLDHIGRSVDELIACDVLAYGVIGPLFGAALEAQGGTPLSLAVARLLVDRLRGEGSALLLTGLMLPGMRPHGETDGPLGTAALARALSYGLDTPVAVAVEAELAGMMATVLRRAGLQIVAPEDLVASRGRRPAAAVLALPTDDAAAREAARRWIEALDLRVAVSVERNGINRDGRYCMVNGADLTDGIGRGAMVFAECTAAGVPTVGIGDRGNELGFGAVSPFVSRLLPKGPVAADVTAATLCLPATISNWGCYGVATCLAAILDDAELLHSAAMEHGLAEAALAGGAIDGMSGRAELMADGIAVEVSAAIATLLGEVFRARSARNPSPHSTPLIR